MSDDVSYTDRMASAIWRAILQTGAAEDGETSILLTGKIFEALLLNASFVASTSEAVSTPQKRRQFCKNPQRKTPQLPQWRSRRI